MNLQRIQILRKPNVITDGFGWFAVWSSLLKITSLSEDNIKLCSWIIHFSMMEKISFFLFIWSMFLHQCFSVKLVSCPSIPRHFVCKGRPVSMELWVPSSFQSHKDIALQVSQEDFCRLTNAPWLVDLSNRLAAKNYILNHYYWLYK